MTANAEPEIAHLERRHYADGAPFVIVVCPRCAVVLNSGHHYGTTAADHARSTADRHNREEHGEFAAGYAAGHEDRARWVEAQRHGDTIPLAQVDESIAWGQGYARGWAAHKSEEG